ncbi:MAG: hypothetical protein F6K18_29840 [Okeania sp. SIO2C2]|nr:hypothetical protein [Okeania sp. SIO2C2]NEP90681.1 hypothetical protein [Okeania sp. SIO2C2]
MPETFPEYLLNQEVSKDFLKWSDRSFCQDVFLSFKVDAPLLPCQD